MADIDQERLLNDLLGGIADEDRQLDARHLEAAVLDACRAHASTPEPSSAYRRLVVICAVAAVVALVAAASIMPRTVERRDTVETPPTAVQEIVVARDTAPLPAPAAQKPRRPTSVRPQPAAVAAEAVEHPAVPEAPIEFVPLMPLTPHEMSGPFQIMRVQMRRASLGPLRSPLEHPSELVEADVLLGEDGTARAIRLSTNGSIYPWRSR